MTINLYEKFYELESPIMKTIEEFKTQSLLESIITIFILIILFPLLVFILLAKTRTNRFIH